MKIEKWTCGEISFTAQDSYNDSFNDVDLTVTFKSESGTVLIRPAFWDGGNVWRVRFAPTELGVWQYTTSCTNKGDKGLHQIIGEVECVPYEGELDIYKHGFVRVSDNSRYFVYDDGTPFFYLGDTHWLMPKEEFDTSNVEGIDSQFKFCVDYRLSQGFTVYQSEPLSAYLVSFANGVNEKVLDGIHKQLDNRFAYIAEKGLLHTNAQLFFASEIQNKCYTPEYIVKLTKMWSARYGAYPVMWTVAQEVDPDFYTHADVAKWAIVGETLYLNDCYKHPLTGHMCNENRCFANNTLWGNKYYHSWFGMQPQGMSNKCFKEFYDYKPTKPIINYETGYEHLWNSEAGALNAGYRAFLNGAFGYGYGAHGVWNGNNAFNSWMDYGGYMRWFEGMMLPAAKKLWYMREFFMHIDWYNITPCFDDDGYYSHRNGLTLAHLGEDALLYDYTTKGMETEIKGLTNSKYDLLVYYPNNGNYCFLGVVSPIDGCVTLPSKETAETVMFILAVNKNKYIDMPLSIRSRSRETLLRYKGEVLQLEANKAVTWSVDDADIATVSQSGVLTANGKNGVVTVIAKSGDEIATRKFVAVRQDKATEPATGDAIKVHFKISGREPDYDIMKEGDSHITVLPEFVPENTWYQNGHVEIIDKDGNPFNALRDTKNYLFVPVFDSQCYITFVSDAGLKSEPRALTLEGFGTPSLTYGASVTCDDYHKDYDERCLPERAVNGDTACFTGWCSEKSCSEDNPAILTVTLKEKSKLNSIKLYTTNQGYTLRSFDIILANGNQERKVAQIRDNELFKLFIEFEAFETEQIKVVCIKGDGNGNARVDQLDAFYNE